MAITSKEFSLDYRLLRLIMWGYDNKCLGNMDQGIPYYQIKHVLKRWAFYFKALKYL